MKRGLNISYLALHIAAIHFELAAAVRRIPSGADLNEFTVGHGDDQNSYGQHRHHELNKNVGIDGHGRRLLDPEITDFNESNTFYDSIDKNKNNIETGKEFISKLNSEFHLESILTKHNEDHHRRIKSKGKLTPEDHLVTNLPYLDPASFPTKHYAGHISASPDKNDKKLFYWLFEPDLSEHSEMKDSEIPLLIWMNGGPGCSSMDGLFLENGPFRFRQNGNDGNANPEEDNWTIEVNDYSWHKSPAYVLYIDQPVGTGLSFTKKKNFCKNDLQINIDFHYFLVQFLFQYQDFFLDNNNNNNNNARPTINRPLYFSGESHAGHYIPSMMDYILSRNDDTSPKTQSPINILLAGAAIGNGWIEPYYQYAAATAAYGDGLIGMAQKVALDAQEVECQRKMKEEHVLASGICYGLLDDIVAQSAGKTSSHKVSIYDDRIWEKKGDLRSFPLGHEVIETYLSGFQSGARHPKNMEVDHLEVLDAIHAAESVDAKQVYRECTDPPFDALAHQDGLGVMAELQRVLDYQNADVPPPRMLLFNGMNDLVCNHVGNEVVLEKLPWRGRDAWILSGRYSWETHNLPTNNGPLGYVKEHENLIFLKVKNSGHMVPMDLPDVSLEMMKTFMFHGSFQYSLQTIKSSLPRDSDDNSDGGSGNCEPCPTCNLDLEPASDGASVVSNRGGSSSASAYTEESTSAQNRGAAIAFVAAGWVGAILGVTSVLMFIVLRKKINSRNGGAMEMLRDEDDYDLSLEMEHRFKDDPTNDDDGEIDNNGRYTDYPETSGGTASSSAREVI